MEKCTNFIRKLATNVNKQLLETIETAFKLIFEAPSTDDANVKRHGQPVGVYGTPHAAIKFDPNDESGYFPQTIANKNLEQVIHAQTGGAKFKLHPKAGKGSLSLDTLKSGQGRKDNANIDSGEWAGDSGGYNLGGPLNSSNSY